MIEDARKHIIECATEDDASLVMQYLGKAGEPCDNMIGDWGTYRVAFYIDLDVPDEDYEDESGWFAYSESSDEILDNENIQSHIPISPRMFMLRYGMLIGDGKVNVLAEMMGLNLIERNALT